MRTYDEINNSSENLISPDGTIAIRLNSSEENMLILCNPIPRAKMIKLPDGEWYLHISDVTVSENPMATFCEAVIVPPISGMVLIKKKG